MSGLYSFISAGLDIFSSLSGISSLKTRKNTCRWSHSYLPAWQLGHSNIALILVDLLYKIDTPTNVLPSIHIFNSIGMCMAFSESKHATSIMKKGTTILTIGIIISTFLIKQHGIIDALSAVVLSIILYVIVYKKNTYLLKRKS